MVFGTHKQDEQPFLVSLLDIDVGLDAERVANMHICLTLQLRQKWFPLFGIDKFLQFVIIVHRPSLQDKEFTT